MENSILWSYLANVNLSNERFLKILELGILSSAIIKNVILSTICKLMNGNDGTVMIFHTIFDKYVSIQMIFAVWGGICKRAIVATVVVQRFWLISFVVFGILWQLKQILQLAFWFKKVDFVKRVNVVKLENLILRS